MARNEKKLSNISDILDDFTIKTDDDNYDFETDYVMK